MEFLSERLFNLWLLSKSDNKVAELPIIRVYKSRRFNLNTARKYFIGKLKLEFIHTKIDEDSYWHWRRWVHWFSYVQIARIARVFSGFRRQPIYWFFGGGEVGTFRSTGFVRYLSIDGGNE